jgi:perosamine synthetase
LDIGPGDEVILPASTIASCYFAIWYTGAKAVPVDVDPNTFNIDYSLIESAITEKTKAIMLVHLYGQACDMDRIMEIAAKNKIKVIEDASQAHGVKYKDRFLGSFGDIACFSLYANKLVTAGEGGIIITNSNNLEKKIRQLLGLNCIKGKRFVHQGIGYRYNISNLEAATALASLEEIEKNLEKKEQMAEIYYQNLENVPGLTLPFKQKFSQSNYWMFAVLVNEKNFGINRDGLMKILLEDYHIETRTFFYPPDIAFAKLGKYKNNTFPVAKKISEEGLYLPSGLGTSKEEFIKVAEAIKEINLKFK